MDLSALFSIIENNFWVHQIFTYSSTTLLDYTFVKLKDKSRKKNLSWQLLHCLQNAHSRTCNQLNWEYNPEAYIEVSKEIINNNIDICNESNIINIFATAVGHPISIKDVKCWLNNFEIELASNEHEHLREFIKIKLLIKEKSISDIQRRYIEKFQQIILASDNLTLPLYRLYIPNEYSLNDGEIAHNDLLELVDAFINKHIIQWLQQKEIEYSNKVDALFIFGHQCTGKSTLVSKIIYDHYSNNELNSKNIYVVNFSDRSFRNQELTPRDICKYLSINVNSLTNGTLIIDGLDESEWSSTEASNNLEHLINDLREYNCQLIVTSRPNFLYSIDFKNSLDIQLRPFSIEQAIEWIKIYQEFNPSCDAESITQQIHTLSDDIRNVILIPYVLYTCITHNIQFDQITEIARLYDMVFYGDEAEFLTTPYNTKFRNTRKEWLMYQKAITEISQYSLCVPNNLIPTNIIDALLQKYSTNSNRITSEFLLYRKDNDSYAFIHNSIPCYFIARYLFNVFLSGFSEKYFDKLISEIDHFCKNSFLISSSIIDFIEYFVRSDTHSLSDSAIEFLKLFLSKQFNNTIKLEADLESIQEYYYLYFVNVVRLVFAFISPSIKPFESFEFFDLLSQNEKNQFITYTKLGEASLDCLKICSFSHHNLSGINMQGVNLRGKLMRHSLMRCTNMIGANLSGAYFIDSDFSLSCFDNANCKNIDFTNSVLFGCSFRNARLNGADFTTANLDHADFRGAQLNKCKFNGASVTGSKILVEQLRTIFDFDIDYIRKNKIKVYCNEFLIPDELLEDEYRKQRPVSYVLNHYYKQID